MQTISASVRLSKYQAHLVPLLFTDGNVKPLPLLSKYQEHLVRLLFTDGDLKACMSLAKYQAHLVPLLFTDGELNHDGESKPRTAPSSH